MSCSHIKTILRVNLLSFYLNKGESPADIQPLVSRFALGKPVNCVTEKNFVSGSHFLTKPLEKMLVMNLTLFIAVSTTSFRIFDRFLTPAHARSQKQWVTLTCHQAVQPSAVPGAPSVHRVSQFFFPTNFCLAKKCCTILKLLTTFPVSKKEMGLFLWWHQHAHNRPKTGAGCPEKHC